MDLFLAATEFAINDSVHLAHKTTPFQLMYGEDPPSQLDLYLNNSAQYLSNQPLADGFVERWRRALQDARSKLLLAQQENKKYYDKHHVPVIFKEGDQVMLKVDSLFPPHKRGLKPKLCKSYDGPFTVLSVYQGEPGNPTSTATQ